MKTLRTILGLGVLFISVTMRGQDTSDNRFASIDFSTGFTQYGNTDEYISKTRYSGSFFPVSINWNRFREGKGFHIGLEVADFSDLENSDIPNLSASVLDFRLPINHYYRVSSLNLFNREGQLYIGPGYGIHAYERKQNVAQGGRLEQKVSSFILQFPLRINARLYLPLNEKWDVIGETSLSLVTASLRSDLSDEFDAQVLAFNKNFEGLLYLTLNYAVMERLDIFIAVKNRLIRIPGMDQNLYVGQTGGEIGAKINLGRKS